MEEYGIWKDTRGVITNYDVHTVTATGIRRAKKATLGEGQVSKI